MKLWTLFEPQQKNFKCQLKIEGSPKKKCYIKRLISIPSPLQQYYFQAVLTWWHPLTHLPHKKSAWKSPEAVQCTYSSCHLLSILVLKPVLAWMTRPMPFLALALQRVCPGNIFTYLIFILIFSFYVKDREEMIL